jgi:hypothetical protein
VGEVETHYGVTAHIESLQYADSRWLGRREANRHSGNHVSGMGAGWFHRVQHISMCLPLTHSVYLKLKHLRLHIYNSKIVFWTLQKTIYNQSNWSSDLKTNNKLHGLSPRANYTDQATATCRQSDCQLLQIEGATWSAWRIPPAVFSRFSRQEPLLFYQAAPQLYSRGW